MIETSTNVQYSAEFIRAAGIVYLKRTPFEVIVGAAEPVPDDVIVSLEAFHAAPVAVEEITREELVLHLSARTSDDIESHAAPIVWPSQQGRLEAVADDEPVVNRVNRYVIEAIRVGASDVHIEPSATDTRVRFRVDGVLEPHDDIPPNIARRIVARIKVLAALDTMDRRRPQDGRVKVTLFATPYDLRVSVIPTVHGESVSIRLCDSGSVVRSISELGFPEPVCSRVRSLAQVESALVVLSGPTGAGKTTTLHAILSAIDRTRRNVVSIEDPVEYTIPGVTHVPVDASHDRGYRDVLKCVLRHDPDVIAVGELRDKEAAELAVRAAMTGHTVFTTLHTRSAPTVAVRLREIGVPQYAVTAALSSSVAQRLVRRLCHACREPMPEPPRRVETALGGFTPSRAWGAVGCTACRNTGFTGRTPIVEYVEFVDGVPAPTTPSMIECAKAVVEAGVSSPEEIARCL